MKSNRATKAEAKVLEKLTRSAAALHLHDGLVYKRNYAAHEAACYWRTYKNEPWEMDCPVFEQDMTIGKLEELLIEHDRNIAELEDRITTALADHPNCDVCDEKTRSYCTCICHSLPTDGRPKW
jgi:hypothetical protein